MKVFLFKRFRGLRLQLKQLYLFQIFPRDIVYYTEFLRSFPISHVKFFSSGVIAIQMLASSFEDIKKGNIRRVTCRTVHLYITGTSLVRQFYESGT